MQENLCIKKTSNNPLIPIISLSIFAIASGYLMSLIPLTLENKNLAHSLASWLASFFYAGLFVGSFISAKIVGKMGHRASLVFFILVLVSTILALSFSNNAAAWLTSRFIAGITVAGIFVVIESWLLFADSEKARAKRLGMYMAALYAGSALGQLGIGIFGVNGDMPLIIAASVMFSAIFPPLLFKSSKPPAITHSNINFKEMRILPSASYIGCFVSGLLISCIYGLLPVELNMTYQTEQVGSLMAVVILGGMLIQPMVSWFNSRVNKNLLMALFSLLGLLALAMIEIATVTAGVIAGLFVLGAATFSFYPIAITLACQKICSSKIVAATELMLLSYSIGSVIGPLFAGSFLQKAQSLMPFLFICFAATLIYMLIASRRHKKLENAQNSGVSPEL